MKRLLPPALFFLSLALMIAIHVIWPVEPAIPVPWSYAGVPIFLGGFLIAVIAKRHFARVGTNINTFRQPDMLVTDGLFRYSRNPMYLGMAVALLGATITIGTLYALLIWVAFVVICDRWYIRFEEGILTESLGEAYLDYKKSVRRWI